MTNQSKKDVVIIIPLYRGFMNEKEKISFFRAIEVFKNREICLVCPKRILDFAIKVSNSSRNISVISFSNFYFKSTKGYNRLLTSIGFYEKFLAYKYILICQLDVYVFKDELDFWIRRDLDNVGAPIFEGYSKPTKKIKLGGNNGGFCLRKVKSCIDVLSNVNFRYYKLSTILKVENNFFWRLFRFLRDGLVFNYRLKYFKPIINEDIFWSIIVPIENIKFIACKPNEAMYFSYDANPRLLYEKCNRKLPMAIHAWWRYDSVFVKNLIDKNK